jgi:hypothetical protein
VGGVCDEETGYFLGLGGPEASIVERFGMQRQNRFRTNYYIVVATATNDRAVRQTKRRVEYRFGMDSSANNASCAIEGSTLLKSMTRA